MVDAKSVPRELDFRHLFPWLALFRSFGIATDIKKLTLAALGVLLMSGGWWLLGELFGLVTTDPEVRAQAAEFSQGPWAPEGWRRFAATPEKGFGLIDKMMSDPLATLWTLAKSPRLVFQPIEVLARPFLGIFSSRSGWLPITSALLSALWAAAVWGVIGGAITRIAAVQFARDEKISLREALRFSCSRFLSFWGAPVIPLFFIAAMTLCCSLGGAVTWIPGGSLVAGALWFLPLIAGIIMALIAIGWAVGWPLMFSTISVEGSDSFDAISRSFAYVFQRPWHYLFYVVVAGIFGSICSFFVLMFADFMIYLSNWAVSWGASDILVEQLAAYAPIASGWRKEVPEAELSGMTSLAARLAAFWFSVVFLFLVGFFYSYLWSAATIIYCLLRRDVDNTELEEVYLEGEDEDLGVIGAESGMAQSPGTSPGQAHPPDFPVSPNRPASGSP